MEAQIIARIAELESSRDAIIAEANRQIAMHNGAIAELRRLLAPPEPPSVPSEASATDGAAPEAS